MGQCHRMPAQTAEQRAEAQRSSLIDQQLKQMQDAESKIRKILLLGTDESGKTTLFKQSKLLFGSGYSEDEMNHFKVIITSNIVEAMRELVRHTEAERLVDDIPEAYAYFCKEDEFDYPERCDEEMARHVKKLWSHLAIKETFANRNEMRLCVQDNVRSFFNQISRIKNMNYYPTEADIINLRQPTIGVVVQRLTYCRHSIVLFDVGGQRNERKKWIHHFDRCEAILFVAAISEFDQVIVEDGETNRLQESIDLFGEICNLPFFQRTHMMLFLNKRDLLREKLELGIDPRVTCPKLFANMKPNPKTGKIDYDSVVDHIVDLFADKNTVPDRSIYCHITCASDPDNVKQVFDIVYDIAFGAQLEKSTADENKI